MLENATFNLRSGEILGLFGASGSGKSSLLRAINGLLSWCDQASVEGEILLDGEQLGDLDPGQRAHLIGSCLDRPEAQLFLPTVRQEINSARRLYGIGDGDTAIGDTGIEELLGVDALMDRRILELSSGERQRVALAAALSARQRPLLLDEPTAHLDEEGAAALKSALEKIRESGGSALIAEQAGWRLREAFDRWLGIQDSALCDLGFPEVPKMPCLNHDPGEKIVFEAENLSAVVGSRVLFHSVDLRLRQGELLVISGKNGAGKSTLARIMAGHARARSGSCRFSASTPPALMLPDASLQLFARTVEGELRTRGVSRAEIARVLERHRLDTLAARAPWSLSRGERQRLVHAAIDMLRPEVVIIDEPAQGLDSRDFVSFMELLVRRVGRGRSYIILSHRAELRSCCHRHFELGHGRLERMR